MTEAEQLVATLLPACWVWNYPVALGRRQEGYPTNYKLDFANPNTKQGLEVDGNSHNMSARKAQDKKKEAKLAGLGWSVLRITNKEVLSLYSTLKLKEHLTTLLMET
jgi:very-short-patch-repair endonuclease